MLGHGHVPCGPYPVRMVAPKLGDAPHLMQVKEGSGYRWLFTAAVNAAGLSSASLTPLT
jgi:hypothetical protein